MSTSAQVAANQQNAKSSTGPRTQEGKAVSALNNFRHGFTGAFCILGWEDGDEYVVLHKGLLEDHLPSNTTEHLLVQTMAQSYWLRQRAINLQNMCFEPEAPMCKENVEKDLALYLRYQTTHDRAFTKALDQLLKLRAEERKEQIGFESQERKRHQQACKEAEQRAANTRRQAQEEHRAAQEKRREAADMRAEEMHRARVSLTEARIQRHQNQIGTARALKTPSPEQPEAAKAA
jgi:low affinity Fe/Cu permease